MAPSCVFVCLLLLSVGAHGECQDGLCDADNADELAMLQVKKVNDAHPNPAAKEDDPNPDDSDLDAEKLEDDLEDEPEDEEESLLEAHEQEEEDDDDEDEGEDGDGDSDPEDDSLLEANAVEEDVDEDEDDQDDADEDEEAEEEESGSLIEMNGKKEADEKDESLATKLPGLWKSDMKGYKATIAISGSMVTIKTEPAQPWSPASGFADARGIFITQPASVTNFAGLLLDKDFFNSVDTDKSNDVSKKESLQFLKSKFAPAMATGQMSKEDLKSMAGSLIDPYDTNKDGSLQLAEVPNVISWSSKDVWRRVQ